MTTYSTVTVASDCDYQSNTTNTIPSATKPAPSRSRSPLPPVSTPPPLTNIPDDKCAPLRTYENYYNVSLDTRNHFLESPIISGLAENSAAPAGYTQVFKNQHGRISTDKFRRLADEATAIYEPFDCAARCDSIPGCVSFDIFFERLPTLNPSEYCSNPRATVKIGCTFWNGRVDGTMAAYVGEQR